MEQYYKVFLACLFVHKVVKLPFGMLIKVTLTKDSVMEFSFDLCLMFSMESISSG